MGGEAVEVVIDNKLDEENPILFRMYRSWRYFLAYVVAILGISGILLRVELVFGSELSLPFLGSFSLWWLTLVPILISLEFMRRYHNDLYVFEKDQVKQISGRLSLQYKIPIVKYLDIRAITVEQGLFGRLLNYGTVALGTASSEGNELEIAGIANPLHVATKIDDLRTNCERALRAQ